MQLDDALTVSALLQQLDQLKPGAALALNQQILPRERWEAHIVQDGDQILLFRLSQGAEMLRIADKQFDSHCLPVPGNLPTQR
jgi:thiamine biosynthesis protein ThiS